VFIWHPYEITWYRIDFSARFCSVFSADEYSGFERSYRNCILSNFTVDSYQTNAVTEIGYFFSLQTLARRMASFL